MSKEVELIKKIVEIQEENLNFLRNIARKANIDETGILSEISFKIEELEDKRIKIVSEAKPENSFKVQKQEYGKEWQCVRMKEGEKEIKIDENRYILKSYMADLTENYLKRLIQTGKLSVTKGNEKEFEYLLNK